MADTLADIQRAQDGDRHSEQEAVENNLALVHSICKRFAHRGVEYEDLFQLGSLGLLKAIRRFDTSFGVCFSTYAVPLIIGEIKRYLRDDGLVKCSRSAKSLALQAHHLCQKNENMTVDELAAALNVTSEEVAIALSSTSSVLSLDASANDEGATILQFFGTESFENDAQNRLLVEQMMNMLQPKEQLLIKMRFYQNKTQTEVAKRLNLSQVQVSRMERKILQSLRERVK